MITIYSIMEQRHPYENIALFFPFILCSVIGTIILIKDYYHLEEKLRKDCAEFFLKMIGIVIMLSLLVSYLVSSWMNLDEYVDVFHNNGYNIAEGYVENMSEYIIKDGAEGVETEFSINGINFDTGNSYGVNNKISPKDIQLMRHNYVVVKYITEKDINGEYIVILELLVDTDKGDNQGTVSVKT